MAFRRLITRVLAVIGLVVVVSFALALLLVLFASRGPDVPESAMLVLAPSGALHDVAPADFLGQVIGAEARTVRSVVDMLQVAQRDDRIAGVLLMPSMLEVPYWAKLQELRDALLEFRRSGKRVVAFLESAGNAEYYLASAADRVFLVPTSLLDLTGIASYSIFLRGALDEVGAYPDFMEIGEYKTAPHQFTQRGFTPAHREMMESITEDLYEQMIDGIAEARQQTPDAIRALLSRGPFLPDDALAAGLVDGLAYEDELDDLLPELRGESGEMPRVEAETYQYVTRESVGIRPGSRIAVVHAAGAIVSGESRYDPINGPLVGSASLVDDIRRVRDDESIRAVVLRIDSPGGSAVDSDVIWRELTIARDDNPARPLIVSMSDLAASGGYYIAMPGQVIVAEPATLTGSIGIYSGKLVIDGTLGKLGVEAEEVLSAPNAGIHSPFAPYTPDQRESISAYMHDFYDTFVQKAAESRNMTPEAIDAIARGRVWTGRQALANGLVDRLGGLDTAIAVAKERAGIPADEDVELVIYPASRTLLETLAEELQQDGAAGVWAALTGGRRAPALASLAAPLQLFRRGEPLALMPFTLMR